MRIFGFAGFSGSGKTTLIEKLIPLLGCRGFRVSVIKHAHHAFDVDTPGKDSYRHRQAGCGEVLVTSSKRRALTGELRGAPEPSLSELVAKLSPCDLVIVEGFEREPIPKLEVRRRAAEDRGMLFTNDPYIVAIASDEPAETTLPQFGLDDVEPIAEFVLRASLPVSRRPRLAVSCG